MKHTFDIDIAKEYGPIEAILLDSIYYWIEHNKANDRHFYDGKYWTYNSIKAFEKLFPYLSTKRIRTALSKLKEYDLIEAGNYNKLSYDRTLWYALTEKAKGLCQKGKTNCPTGQMELPERASRIAPQGEPIPTNYPTNYTTNNPTKSKSASGYTDGFILFWNAYPNKKVKATAFKAWQKISKEPNILDTVLQAIEKHKNSEDWKKENGRFIPHPATWLNGRRWEDEITQEQKGFEYNYDFEPGTSL